MMEIICLILCRVPKEDPSGRSIILEVGEFHRIKVSFSKSIFLEAFSEICGSGPEITTVQFPYQTPLNKFIKRLSNNFSNEGKSKIGWVRKKFVLL